MSVMGWMDEMFTNCNDYDVIEKPKKEKVDPTKCYHIWELVGRSPVLNEKWYNCSKCKIAKEDHEKSLKEDYESARFEFTD